jgi:HAD superfamily hydrolase (TIGR01549 family)
MRTPIFDLDGTLLDSDRALVQPFLALGASVDDITFGHVIGEECERLGIALDDYLERYDVTAARPYPGVEELVGHLARWAVCSNKHSRSGGAELARLGWVPDVALFTDAFDGPKRLAPVLAALGARADEVVYVGDTAHDRAAAAEIGVPFGLAAWNPRATAEPGDTVLSSPLDVLDFVAGR